MSPEFVGKSYHKAWLTREFGAAPREFDEAPNFVWKLRLEELDIEEP